MTGTGGEGPKLLAGLGIKSEKVTFHIPGEQHVSAGHQQRRKNRILERQTPFFLPGHRIKGVEVRANFSVGRRLNIDIAGDKRPSFASFLWKDRYIRAPLDAVVVPQSRSRAVRRVVPASTAAPVRSNEIWFSDFWLVAADQLSIFVDGLDPGYRVHVRPRVDKLSSHAIEHPNEATLVRMNDKLLGPAVSCDVDQHRLVRGIEVPRVVRNLLIVPVQLSGVGINRDYAVGVEVLAGPHRIIEVRRRIADAPINQIQLRIIRSGEPRRPAAVLPHIGVGPGLVPRLSRSGYRVEPPRESSRLGVERADVAAMRAVASGSSNDDFVFDDEWSAVDIAAAFLYVFDFDVPDLLAGVRVHGYYVVIHRPEEDQSVSNRYAAIELTVRADEIARKLVVIGPQSLAGFRVQSEDTVLTGDQVHDSVYDKGRRVESAFDFTGLKSPHRNEVLDVISADLIERAVAPGVVSSKVGSPVLRLPSRVDQPLAGQLAVPVLDSRIRDECGEDDDENQSSENSPSQPRLFPLFHAETPLSEVLVSTINVRDSIAHRLSSTSKWTGPTWPPSSCGLRKITLGDVPFGCLRS